MLTRSCLVNVARSDMWRSHDGHDTPVPLSKTSPSPAVSSVVMHTDLGYPGYRDGHPVAGVDFIALHIQGQSVQGNPGERQGKTYERMRCLLIDYPLL